MEDAMFEELEDIVRGIYTSAFLIFIRVIEIRAGTENIVKSDEKFHF